MPRKKGWRTPDEIREKIQGSQIINRLQSHVMGEADMSPSQVNAAKTLLGKVIPDLKAIEHNGDPESPLHHKHVIERRVVDPTDRDA